MTNASTQRDAATEIKKDMHPDDRLFSPSLIDAQIQLPSSYTIRPLAESDYSKGYVQLLSQLTLTGNVTEQAFKENFALMKKHGDTYFAIVIEDGANQTLVGAGTLVVEHKFIHDCGRVGHIEDIVVDKDQRGNKLGLRIIQCLTLLSKRLGCYKTILDCSESNVDFYAKCQFEKKGIQMVQYYI